MKGKQVSDDLSWTIIRMAPLMSLNDIEAYTSISKRQIQKILARWRVTGDVQPPPTGLPRGRPQHLTAEDVAVSSHLDVFLVSTISNNFLNSSFKALLRRTAIPILTNYNNLFENLMVWRCHCRLFGVR